MNVFSRGMRNAFRNSVRTISIVIILGLSVGLALTMLVARQAVQTKINSVKSSIGNTITVSPAGSGGFGNAGNPLAGADFNQIKATAHVVGAVASVNDRWDTAGAAAPTSDNGSTAGTTNLVSPITAGSLGRRFGGGGNGGFGGGNNANFTPPIRVTGTTDPANLQVAGANKLTLVSGAMIDGNSTANTALVGKDLASKNNLAVSSTFTAYNSTITVAGIYDAGNTFSNASVIMPLASLQTLSSQPDSITSVVVQVDSITNLASTTTALQNELGSKADVVSAQDTSSQALAPLENIATISLYSLIGAIAAGAVIILLTMLMIVRERRREIGVLKAIGSSNLKVMFQFVTEAVTFTLLGAVVGLGIGAAASNPVTQLLVTGSSNAGQGGGGRFGGGAGGGFVRFAGAGGAGLRNIQTTVGWSLLLYGLGAAILIAIIGSAIPAVMIAKVRPAEVMRAE